MYVLRVFAAAAVALAALADMFFHLGESAEWCTLRHVQNLTYTGQRLKLC